MAEETVGVARTETGAIADQNPTLDPSQPNTNSETPSTEATKPAVEAEGKTLLTEGKKEEPKAEDKKDEKTGAPEKYEEYTVPDGFTLDPTVKTEADKMFKGLGLNQDQAQSLVDFYVKQTTEAAQAPYKAYQEFTENLRKEAESHPDLRGKLGPGQEVNVRIAKALDGLGDPKLVGEFKQFMDVTGAGNSAAFIRVIDKLAQRVTEGTHVAGKGPSTAGQSKPGEAPPTVAAALWPSLPSAMNK